ncbi:MAG: hypothetical protein FWC95_08340, partial [Defluviitaleaceae bacterium]|nr:hypothetical protein [Defluviitaleaceae bacterium]
KLFFKKSGYITKDWYPYFLAARRKGKDFNEAYMDGEISSYAKRIYEVVAAHSRIPSHVIKQEAGFSSEEKAAFDKGLTELQMKLFITVCGNERTANWPSAVFCTTERFWGEALFVEADKIKPDIALKKITEQVLYLNPSAPAKKIIKFINGK